MGFSVNEYHVEALLFNENGKWKYTVCLDYEHCNYESSDLWAEARKALHHATAKGISGVTLWAIPEGWVLIVPNPYGKYAHPIAVKSGSKVVEAFVQPLVVSSHFNCPICNEQLREPSSQSGRSWCRNCEEYVIAEKAINA